MRAAAGLRPIAALVLAGMAGAPARASTYPEMPISRATSAHEWPFTVEEGTLVCVAIGETRTVIFSEPWRTDVPQEIGNMTLPRSVVVSANPFAMFANIEDRDLLLPFEDLETLILRLAPFERMGWALCDEEADGAADEN